MKTTKLNNVKLKSAIISHARAYRDIQEKQCDPIVDAIQSLLQRLYPAMSAEQCADWAIDIINSNNTHSATDVLDRLDNWFKK